MHELYIKLYQGAQAFNAYLAHLAQISNVTILNFYGTKDFTDADFFDPVHLNLNGTLKFSRQVACAVQGFKHKEK